MSDYAPGPWREYDRNGLGDIYLCGNDDGRAVAIVLQAVIPQLEGRTEANARLIAAAPDLLTALLIAHPYTEHVISCQLVKGGPECTCGLLDADVKIKAAIAKATNP